MREQCGLQKCTNDLGPGSAAVGFECRGKTEEVRVCPKHAWILMSAPRGSFVITPERVLKPIPARQIFI